ncbi:MAG: RDD family protein [Dermatophilaceae bacterium]|nr:RDD family protein [Intrasporangiaceae bacterium]
MSPPPSPAPDDATADHPGAELGLPPRGPGSLASLLRRALAAVIDWLLSQLIAVGLLDVAMDGGGAGAFAPLGIFALMHILLVGTIGTTIGHKIVGIEVRALDGGPVRPTQALIRTLMVVLFLPAVFTTSDGRGFHDKAAGAMTIRSR